MKSKTNKKNIMKKRRFVDLMRQQGWAAEEVKEMVEVPLCGCVRAGVPDEYGDNPPRDGIDPDGVRIGQNAGWSSSRATACATTTSTRATACW